MKQRPGNISQRARPLRQTRNLTPTPSGAATAITKVGLRERRHHRRPGQIPIDLEAPRDFVPWRFSDACNPLPNPLRRAGRPRNLHNNGHSRGVLSSLPMRWRCGLWGR